MPRDLSSRAEISEERVRQLESELSEVRRLLIEAREQNELLCSQHHGLVKTLNDARALVVAAIQLIEDNERERV